MTALKKLTLLQIQAAAVLIALAFGMPTASADSDPNFESPLQFIRNEYERQNALKRQPQQPKSAPLDIHRATGAPVYREETVKRPRASRAEKVSEVTPVVSPQDREDEPVSNPKSRSSSRKLKGTSGIVSETEIPSSEIASEPITEGPLLEPTSPRARKPTPASASLEMTPGIVSVDGASAPVSQGEICPPGMTPPTGISKTANFGREVSATLAKNSQPKYVFVPSRDEDEELSEYESGYKGARKRPQTPTQAPAETPSAGEPKNEFVKKLLRYAKIEADRKCRTLQRGTKCGRGPKGACLQGVRMAFQRAKGESTASGWTMHAKNAGPHLRRYGFKKVSVSSAKNAPVGAVFIYDAPGNPRKSGHIEIKGTDGYYSDYYSRYMINDRRGLGLNRRLIEVWVPN